MKNLSLNKSKTFILSILFLLLFSAFNLKAQTYTVNACWGEVVSLVSPVTGVNYLWSTTSSVALPCNNCSQLDFFAPGTCCTVITDTYTLVVTDAANLQTTYTWTLITGADPLCAGSTPPPPPPTGSNHHGTHGKKGSHHHGTHVGSHKK